MPEPQETSRAKHTPGPWTVKRGDGRYAYRHYIEAHVYSTPTVISGRDQIAQCTAGEPNAAENEANARLIAAGPELLDACKQALDLFEDDEGIAQVLMAAIAKAEGRS